MNFKRRDKKPKNKLQVEGYLVESQSLAGLSGSPVFVRPEVSFDPEPLGFSINTDRPKGSKLVRGGAAQLFLLGLWQGAWEAPPDEVKATQSGAAPGAKVPVGMGVVVPCYKILELLEMPQVKAYRDGLLELCAKHGIPGFVEAEVDGSNKR